MHRSKIVTASVLLLAALMMVVAGCSGKGYGTNYNNNGGNTNGTPGASEVWLQSSAFNPSSRSVAVGATVTWTNKDSYTHTVTSGTPGSPNGTFDSGNMAGNATFTHTFSAAGTFPYYCRIHGAMMTGSIVVH
jgi:plastocyanin